LRALAVGEHHNSQSCEARTLKTRRRTDWNALQSELRQLNHNPKDRIKATKKKSRFSLELKRKGDFL
jgi:hypothetical protein